MDLKELESGVNPFTHWYYQSKKIPMFNYLNLLRTPNNKFHLIDLGAGSGFFSEEINMHFKDRISSTTLVDIGYSDEEIEKSTNETMLKQQALPESISNSLVLMMDVLEHIDDDITFLNQLKSKSNDSDNNYFFITVPAFQSVWSEHDVFLEHYRRYTKSSLKKLLFKTNFKPTRIYYLYGSLFPFVFIKRQFGNFIKQKNDEPKSDMKPLPHWLNKLLLRYSSIEMMITKLNIFFGLTCVAEGRF